MAEIIVTTTAGDRLLIHARRGESFRSVLLREGIMIDFPCGGQGSCGKCRITVDPPPASGLVEGLPLPENMRLACQARVEGDCRLVLPPAGPPEAPVALSGEEGGGHLFAGTSCIRRRLVRLPPPELTDQRADRERLLDALTAAEAAEGASKTRPIRIHPGLLAEISAALRAGEWRGMAVLDGDQLVGLDSPDGEAPLGFAVDVGTTTIDIALHAAESGALVARRLLPNRQTAYGADVITRARHFQEEPEAVRRALLTSIDEGAAGLLSELGLAKRRVVRSVLVGNPIMLHILHGFDPSPLTRAPYIPLFSASLARSPSDFAFSFQTRGRVETLPLISAYVGADTVGMMLALDLEHEREISLAVDIGTNGEIVLAGNNGFIATSTAAGPAFEGAQISCGMRAEKGAICAVRLFPDREPELEVLGGGRPRGLCGSGLISCVAALLDARLLDKSGRLLPDAGEGEPGYRRFIQVDGQPAFRLDRQGRIYVTQKDIRQFQLAKAAVRTGIEMLLRESGITADRVRRLRLAGNFGSGLRAREAMRVGLIPELPAGKVDLVGNAALRGAALALVSESYRRRALKLPAKTRFLELAGRADFQNRFTDALFF